MVEFFIPGLPVAKQRPKFAVRGGFARAYTPAKTVSYEKLVSQYGRIAIKKPLEGPLLVDLLFTLPIPASTSKKRAMELLNGPHIKKPDLSNLQKAVEDGLNSIAYLDDCQIFDIHARKIYGDKPGVLVRISLPR
jgi:Holliday junction resolvase RusA-like endonuclease